MLCFVLCHLLQRIWPSARSALGMVDTRRDTALPLSQQNAFVSILPSGLL
jgi:hypothetical protein